MTVQEFRSLLSLAEKGVTRRSTQPVQCNILVERDSAGRCRLSATDLEFVEVSAWEEGFDGANVRYRVTLPPKQLKAVLKGKPAKADVELRPVTQREADVAIAGAVSRIIGLPAEDHELLPAPKGVNPCSLIALPQKDLDTLERVARACTEDLTRPTLTGVLFRFGSYASVAEVMATDTHRLARALLTGETSKHAERAEYIIAETALRVLFAAGKREPEPIRTLLTPNIAEFCGTGWRIRTRPVEGQFPPCDKVTPDRSEQTAGFVARAEDLRTAVGAVLHVAQEDAHRLALVPQLEHGVRFLASADTGNAQTLLPAAEVNGNGQCWPIGVNAKFLSDALPEAGTVTVTWKGKVNPFLITAPGEVTTVLMPMQLEHFPFDAFDAEPAPVEPADEEPADVAPEPEPPQEPEPEPVPCDMCEGTGELLTRTGQVRPCPQCRSTASPSPEPAEGPATSAEVEETPETVPGADPAPVSVPSSPVPALCLADKETRKADVVRALDDFCAAIASGARDDTFDAFLSYAARFHRYSWRNTLLIMLQRPDATFVAGYHRWRDLGRSVRRGSKAIWILAPARYTKTVTTDDGGEDEVEAIFFKPVPVFADLDTEGDGPVPNFRAELPDAAAIWNPLLKVAASWSVPVLRQGCRGNGWSDGDAVNIKAGLPEGVAAQTLIHELAHHLLKHRDLADKHEGDRALFEGEAEAVKVVVLRHFGVDTSSNGASYLRAYGAGADVVKRSAHRIVQTAKTIIEGLEAVLAEPEVQAVAAG